MGVVLKNCKTIEECIRVAETIHYRLNQYICNKQTVACFKYIFTSQMNTPLNSFYFFITTVAMVKLSDKIIS